MTVAANRELIKRDIGEAKDLLDTYGRLAGQAYQELTMLSYVMAHAAEFLLTPMKGQFDDIAIARELNAAIVRATLAVKAVREAA